MSDCLQNEMGAWIIGVATGGSTIAAVWLSFATIALRKKIKQDMKARREAKNENRTNH